MRFQKYIILKNQFTNEVKIRIGYPMFHEDLITKTDKKNGFKCVGGGQWSLNYGNKTISLFGKSCDFGRPKNNDIELAIKNIDIDEWLDFEILCDNILKTEIELFYDKEPDFSDINQYKFIIQDY